MPKAPINKDGEVKSRNIDVRTTGDTLEMDAVTHVFVGK
jgi:hypothetical protein